MRKSFELHWCVKLLIAVLIAIAGLGSGIIPGIFGIKVQSYAIEPASPSFVAEAGRALPAPGTGQVFRDCEQSKGCPELIVVPAAMEGVQLGSPESEPGRVDNEKQHTVKLSAFAIGRTEVSVSDYAACVTAGKCPQPEWREADNPQNIETGTGLYYKSMGKAVSDGNQPIVGVSYDDAITYAKWLSSLTGQDYRLPSESEWEYAARAGSKTAYWWGDEPNKADGSARAVCSGCGVKPGSQSPAAVDSFAPNPWGLHNMHGNVWEWVAGYYCEDYALAPADGSAKDTDDCPVKDAEQLHVLRGGSGFYGPDKMRSASRLRNFAGFRNFSVGFRVARSIRSGKIPDGAP